MYRSGTGAPVAVGSSKDAIDFENIHAGAISVAPKDLSCSVNARSQHNMLNADSNTSNSHQKRITEARLKKC